MNAIKFENVNSVYSGRPGCCCGCRGKHTHRTGKASQSYDVENDRVVRNHLAKINANLNIAMAHSDGIGDNAGHVVVEFPNRIYIAYLSSMDGTEGLKTY